MTPQASAFELYPTVQQEVSRLAASSKMRSAFEWFRARESQIVNWQMEVARIAAPPFGEQKRAAWLVERFHELGLSEIHTDNVGNVIGIHTGYGNRYVAVSAHIDTVFPAATALNIKQQGKRLFGPAVSDNSAGIAAMLAVAAALRASEMRNTLPFVFIGNVGEEGEGDLRGMRHVFATPRWSDGIAYSIVIDGAGSDTVVSEALGSRRFEVTVRGPGGHSWSDFGAPSPTIAIAKAIDIFSQTPIPTLPKTTFNVGVLHGGTSVNSIPESASMRIDLRSTAMSEIDRMEGSLRAALDQAIEAENAASTLRCTRRPPPLSSDVVMIGNRPAGELDPDARILKVIRAVDSHLGNNAQIQRASTDANIPLSMGREAIAIGAGGSGGGAHTLQEWFDCNGRELGLKRILLTMLALAGTGE